MIQGNSLEDGDVADHYLDPGFFSETLAREVCILMMLLVLVLNLIFF